MEWIPLERRKRGRPRKTWMAGVQAAMTSINLEPDQWRNREEWRLRTSKKNVDGRSTSSHDIKKFRTRSMEK
jgi:hypothetical protein